MSMSSCWPSAGALGLAEISELLGLSLEIGAFVAGVTIATSPIAMYIADHLKPLRDFFLVLFFFSLEAPAFILTCWETSSLRPWYLPPWR